MEALFKALGAISEVSELYGINLIKQSVNGVKFKQYDFSLLLYFLTLGVGLEVKRDQIIDDTYVTPDYRDPSYRIQEHTIDGFILRLNKSLDRAKFEYRIKNFGGPRDPRGFQLTKVVNTGIYEEVGEQ